MPGIRLNPPDLDALDVALTWAYRPECQLLLEYLNDEVTSGILVLGEAKVGKTGMVNSVIDRPNPRFPGGILEIHKNEFTRRDFSLPVYPDTLAPKIILIDCKNAAPPKLMLRSYEEASRGRRDKYIIIARTEAVAANGVRLPDGFVTLEVKGFAADTFSQQSGRIPDPSRRDALPTR